MQFPKVQFVQLVISILFYSATLIAQTNNSAELAARQISDKIASLNAKNCQFVLADVNKELYRLSGDQFVNEKNVKYNANTPYENAISLFFLNRIKLNQFWGKAMFENSIDDLQECSDQVQALFRNLREQEDRLGINTLYGRSSLSSYSAQNMLFEKSIWPAMLTNPDQHNKISFAISDLKTGDILLSRSSAFTTSVIARIGKVDNQFSHLSIVYVDDGSLFSRPGQVYVVESQPETGVRIITIENYLRHDKARVAVFRYSPTQKQNLTDPQEIARQTAHYIAAQAYPFSDLNDENDMTEADRWWVLGEKRPPKICYNFSMDMNNESCQFCSQTVAIAFNKVCEDQNNKCLSYPSVVKKNNRSFPAVYSKMDVEKNSLIQLLSINSKITFEPADIEMDPRFKLVAEWRDYSVLPVLRIHDMVATKIFQLAEDYNYKFKLPPFVDVLAKLAKKTVVEIGKMPDSIPVGYVNGTIMYTFLVQFYAVSDEVLQKIDQYSDQQLADVLAQFTKGSLTQDEIKSMVGQTKSSLLRVLSQNGLIPIVDKKQKEMLLNSKRVMTLFEMDQFIDQLRIADCQKFKKGVTQGIFMHDFFNPNTDASQRNCLDTEKSLDFF